MFSKKTQGFAGQFKPANMKLILALATAEEIFREQVWPVFKTSVEAIKVVIDLLHLIF